MKNAEVVIVGTGSLATGVVHALSQVSTGRLRVAIIGRSPDKVGRMALLANGRGAAFRTAIRFEPLHMEPVTALAVSRTIRRLKPRVIFHTASLQSPWEGAANPSRWTKLVGSAGLGVTLPLQMSLAVEVSRGASDRGAAIVNACYPDGVNVALHRLGLPVTCGIGNSAIVEAFCRAHAKVGYRDVRVVGHHAQLAPWLKAKRAVGLPRVWVDGREIETLRLRPHLGSIEEDLNDVTSATAAVVLLALISGEPLHTSIPGVNGLPGGYPFEITGGAFKMRLPAGISREQAIAHNKGGERMDGVDLGTSLRFVGKARGALESVGFEYAEGFEFEDWAKARDRLLALRKRLRS